MTFVPSSLLFGLFFALWAVVFAYGAARRPDFCRKLPRARIAGAILGVACLWWASNHLAGMLEGSAARFRLPIRLGVPVIAILGYIHLDYLFARACGGVLVLVVNFLLHEAFVLRLPMRPVYSLACYAVGIAGLFLLATPWRLRDVIERAEQSPRWRAASAAVCGLLGLLFIGFAAAA